MRILYLYTDSRAFASRCDHAAKAADSKENGGKNDELLRMKGPRFLKVKGKSFTGTWTNYFPLVNKNGNPGASPLLRMRRESSGLLHSTQSFDSQNSGNFDTYNIRITHEGRTQGACTEPVTTKVNPRIIGFTQSCLEVPRFLSCRFSQYFHFLVTLQNLSIYFINRLDLPRIEFSSRG